MHIPVHLTRLFWTITACWLELYLRVRPNLHQIFNPCGELVMEISGFLYTITMRCYYSQIDMAWTIRHGTNGIERIPNLFGSMPNEFQIWSCANCDVLKMEANPTIDYIDESLSRMVRAFEQLQACTAHRLTQLSMCSTVFIWRNACNSATAMPSSQYR